MFQRESKRIGLACFVGASVGTILSTVVGVETIWQQILAIVGILAGGAVGWLVYDLPAVWHAFRRAFRQTVAWRPDKKLFLDSGKFTLAFLGLLVLGLLGPALLYGVIGYLLSEKSVIPAIHGLSILIWFVSLYDGELCDSETKGVISRLKTSALMSLGWPFVLIIGVLFLFYFALYESFMAVLSTVKWSLVVIKRTFVYVHSAERRICFVDSIIGGVVGYWLAGGNVAYAGVGGLVGAIVGIANYELISIRWLKLAPRSS